MTKMEAREWLRTNTGMELPDDDKIEAEEEEQKQMQKDQMNKVKKLESQVKQFYKDAEDSKNLQELQEKFDSKLTQIREAIKLDKDKLADRRIKTLETLLKKANGGL